MSKRPAKLFPGFRLQYKLFRQYLKSIGIYFLVRQRFTDDSTMANAGITVRSVFNPRKAILFFPDRPAGDTMIFKLCALSGYAITTNPGHSYGAAFKWKDATVFDPAELQKIPDRNRRIINAGSLNISKSMVSSMFAEVFGYPLAVDPAGFQGPMVEKPERNARHYGRLLEGPIPAEMIRPGYAYQKLIGNEVTGGDLVLDYRLPIFGRVIPLVYRKYRPVKSRFASPNTFVEMGKPKDVFSAAELEKILLLTGRIGLDYGEIDVLRDKDGRIYVVDINNTPHGPPDALTKAEKRIALQQMAGAFEELAGRI
jgi:hypothetical protein